MYVCMHVRNAFGSSRKENPNVVPMLKPDHAWRWSCSWCGPPPWLQLAPRPLQELGCEPAAGQGLQLPTRPHALFKGLEKEALFYFLHSYYFKCNDESNVLAETEYGNFFTCAAVHENIYGIQFHPEKSHNYGEILLNNFSKV